jgi:hypothetical protein
MVGFGVLFWTPEFYNLSMFVGVTLTVWAASLTASLALLKYQPSEARRFVPPSDFDGTHHSDAQREAHSARHRGLVPLERGRWAQLQELVHVLFLVGVAIISAGEAYEKAECYSSYTGRVDAAYADVKCLKSFNDDSMILLISLPLLVMPVRQVLYSVTLVAATGLWFAAYLLNGQVDARTFLVAALSVTTVQVLSLLAQRAQEKQSRRAFERYWELQQRREQVARLREYTVSTVEAIVPRHVAQRMTRGQFRQVVPRACVCVMRVGGFARWASQSAPADIATLLQYLRTALDQVTRREACLTRLPSLGDEYAVFTGLQPAAPAGPAEDEAVLRWLTAAMPTALLAVSEYLLTAHAAVGEGQLLCRVVETSATLEAAGPPLEECVALLKTCAPEESVVVCRSMFLDTPAASALLRSLGELDVAVRVHAGGRPSEMPSTRVWCEVRTANRGCEEPTPLASEVTLRAIAQGLQLRTAGAYGLRFADEDVEAEYVERRSRAISGARRRRYFVTLGVVALLMLANSGIAQTLEPVYCFAPALAVAACGALWNRPAGLRAAWTNVALELAFWALYVGGTAILPLGNVISNSDSGWATVVFVVSFAGEAMFHPFVVFSFRQLPFLTAFVLIGPLRNHRPFVEEFFAMAWIPMCLVINVLVDMNRRLSFAVVYEIEVLQGEIDRDLAALEQLVGRVAPSAHAEVLVSNTRTMAPHAGTARVQRIPYGRGTHCTTKAMDVSLVLLRLRPRGGHVGDAAAAHAEAATASPLALLQSHCTVVTAAGDTLLLEPRGEYGGEQAAAAVAALQTLFASSSWRRDSFRAVLLHGTCIGGVLGHMALNFSYFGPAVSAALAVLEEMDWGRVVATPSFVYRLCIHYGRDVVEDPSALNCPGLRRGVPPVPCAASPAVVCVGKPLPWRLRSAGRVLLHDVDFDAADHE